MSAAEVVYSNEEIIMERGNTDGSANSPIETTYSEFGIVRRRPSTELPDGRCRVTSERAAVFVLSVLLAAYLITLGLHLYKDNQTKESIGAVENNLKVCSANYTILQKMIDERDAEIENLTERFSAVKPCKPESPKCPEVNRDCPKCPVGWERHGGKCYYFSTYTATWTSSRDECRRKGGDLVKIESREEQEFLEQKVRDEMTADQDKFWIGLTDSVTERTWLWTDGSALDNSLKFWSRTEPDNYKEVHSDGEDCARMGERGKAAHVMCWFDAPCIDPHKSICEKPEEP
ncbi:hepatic lectin-like [Trematomus bernacchii]|uniref:hepatic lectin-like n=1 Tax=Trematomus bernacchii TaxID=40690 RepID=UPI00146BCE26|nr:hepatic lectin-like [Trematomus bernacchii]